MSVTAFNRRRREASKTVPVKEEAELQPNPKPEAAKKGKASKPKPEAAKTTDTNPKE